MVGNKERKISGCSNKRGNNYYDGLYTKLAQKKVIGYQPTTTIYNKLNKRGGRSISDDIITYFIKTYSNEGDTILDMCCHNKVVGNIIKPLNRNYIGIDIEQVQ